MSDDLIVPSGDLQSWRSLRPPLLKPEHARWIAKLTILAAGAYLLTLVVTLPARTLLAWAGARPSLSASASGTAWNGVVDLGAGVSARWRLAPLTSLVKLSPTADIDVAAPDTSLSGRARWSKGGVVIERLTGVASWSLVEMLAPRLPFGCDATMRVNVDRLALTANGFEALGSAASLPAICRSHVDPAAAPTAAPALVASATSRDGLSTVVVAPRGRPTQTLMSGGLTSDGRLRLSISAAAAALAPGGAVAGPVELEMGP